MTEIIDQIWYTQIYTEDPSNPRGLQDEMATEDFMGGDFNTDGDLDDSLGGHLISPASVVVMYEDESGNDLSLYYRLGQTQSFSAVDIYGCATPEDMSYIFDERTGELVFRYVSVDDGDAGEDSNASGNNTTTDAIDNGAKRD